MNPIIQKLWDTGHFFNASKPNALNVKFVDLDKLTLTHPAVIEAIASFQELDANVEILVQAIHGRALNPDGDIGPATSTVLTFKRCPIPDYPPPPGVNFHFADPDVQRVVESQQAFAMGSGSWPSCDPQRPGVNSFRVNLATGNAPTTIKNYLQKALDAVVAAYADVGCALRYVLDGDANECEISKRFESLSGSVIGWNEFPDPNTCNQVIQGRLDTGYAPSDYRLWANLECHETGHGVGLNHGNGHIMNPSILLVWPLSWRNSYSYANLKRWFGGEPIPLTPGPVPGPTPVPVGLRLLGVITAMQGDQKLGEFVLAPKPQV